MRIVVDINHPGHVHYFKNFIWEMEKRGNTILVTATDKQTIISLLNHYEIPYIPMPGYKGGLVKKTFQIFYQDINYYKRIAPFSPDILLGFGSIRAAHSAWIMRRPFIALDDTEHATHEHLLYVPFATAILTPECFQKDFGRKHIRYKGYTELLYLHPNYFTPNPRVLEKLNVKPGDIYTIIRLVSWEAVHDINQRGIPDVYQLISVLQKYGRVFISSEKELSPDLEGLRLPIEPHELHDALYYASLYIGEGATTASEAVMLGTPAIYVNSLPLGYLDELQKIYHTIINIRHVDDVIKDLTGPINDFLSELSSNNLKKENRYKILDDTVDITDFLIHSIEKFKTSNVD